MPKASEYISLWLDNGTHQFQLSTASIVECDSTMRTLRALHDGTYVAPFKIAQNLDLTMYRAWCDVVLDRRNILAREDGSMVHL